jgi:methionine-rich copper-binding protein CopC
VTAGEVFGFLGPNGAGKSTTIRLLLGLYHATAGRMSVLGGDPTRDVVAIHRRVSYVKAARPTSPVRFAEPRNLTDMQRSRDSGNASRIGDVAESATSMIRTAWFRLASVAALFGLALLLGTGPAAAHSYLASTDPADGATVTNGPSRVSLTFNEALQTSFAAVSVVGPDGNRWSTGDTQVNGAVASIALTELGPVGKYTIAYRVVSADSHPVAGTTSFTLTTPGNGTPGPKADSSAGTGSAGGPSGGASAWPFIVGGVLVLGAGLAVALRSGRRKRA